MDELINVENLHLDLRNPRFLGRNNTEESVFEYLVNDEDVKDLANKIKRNGFIQVGERLIVVNENDKLVVLEGNRRLAACRLVNSESPNLIKDLLCDVVESRSAASRILESRHINGIRKWTSIAKRYFYAEKFLSGQPIDSIYDESDESKSTIKKNIKSYLFIFRFYEINKVDFPDRNQSLEKLDTDIIGGRIFQNLTDDMMLKIDDKTLQVVCTPEQNKILNEVLHRIGRALWIDKKIDTRLINKKNDWEKMVNEDIQIPGLSELMNIYKSIENENKKIIEEENIETVDEEQSNPINNENYQGEKPRKSPTNNGVAAYILDLDFKINCENSDTLIFEKIRHIVRELKYLDVFQYPYSTFTIYRILIELSIKQFYSNHTEYTEVHNQPLNERIITLLIQMKEKALIDREVCNGLISIIKRDFISSLNWEVHRLVSRVDQQSLLHDSKDFSIFVWYCSL